MKEKLLPIQIQLLDRLNRTKEPISSQFLANSLGVSSKTIRKNLSQLNLALSDQGAVITSKTVSYTHLRCARLSGDIPTIPSVTWSTGKNTAGRLKAPRAPFR